LEAVRVAANQGRVWVLDADIKTCFDTIDQTRYSPRGGGVLLIAG